MRPKGKMPVTGKAEQHAGAEAEEDEVEEETAGSTEKQREGGDVSRLTDYVEQREIDSDRATQAVASLMGGAQTAAEHEAEAAREKDLAAVVVDAADVALIAQEMELELAVAERKLREANGDVVECLNILVSV
mmetsp:Transcript_30229/g.97590  ORF Transcript_30229/g.97590 Transcript_30229/m.97590 type:complete len:133 (+) Transcript_30229:63-461(+)